MGKLREDHEKRKPRVETDREEDGRWIGAVRGIAGCHVYGKTRVMARAKAVALAMSVLAESVGAGELEPHEALDRCASIRSSL